MHEPPLWLDELARNVIGTALTVHRALGPGFSEAVYENALAIELDARRIDFRRQARYRVEYAGTCVGEYIIDLLVLDALVVELKSVEEFAPIHRARVRSYLRAAGLELGLLINFNVPLLRDGIRRVIWTGGETPQQKTEQK